MEVQDIAGKSLKNTLTDKIVNRDAEVYGQALDLRGCLGIQNFKKSDAD